MKKLFLFAAAAAMFAACSETEVLDQNANQQAIENQGGVKFDVYAQRGITRGGGQLGDLNNGNIGKNGFGVFAYYTAGEQYDTKAIPNFMYNQQVTLADPTKEAVVGSKWVYEPVKYWPNEYGNAAISDEIDYVTFFAYAPWTPIEPTTGDVIVPDSITNADSIAVWQKKNIISVNKNSATGDPIIKYVVDTDPGTSVDLLWGVAAENAANVYTPIDGASGSNGKNSNVKVKPGFPFIDLVKPNDPQDDRLMFNLKHALAKVKVTIDYIADDFTPVEGPLLPENKVVKIDSAKTRIFVRSFTMSGFATQGALNLNNTEAGEPLWKDFDGVKDLTFNDVTFFDGRKDAAEGSTSGEVKNESPLGLNPILIENTDQPQVNTTTKSLSFTENKNIGVRYEPELLFGGDSTKNKGFFYVIPRNDNNGSVDVTIAYDVETIDTALYTKLSDNETHGISIENVISKKDIFNGLDFKAGYQYEIHIHLGMTSVKMEATVTEWKDTGVTDVELPDNQDPYVDNYWKISGSDAIYTVDPTNFTLSPDRIYIVDSEQMFNAAYNAGPLKDYYTDNSTVDPDPITGKPSWEGIVTVDHQYDYWKEPTNAAYTFGLPWVVLDLKFIPAGFSGTLSIKYKGTTLYATLPSTGSYSNKKYLLMDGTDILKLGGASLADSKNFLHWDSTAGKYVQPANYQPLKASDFTITLTWDSGKVTKYSYATGQPVTD